jgi:DNA-3-methyladenine glycosylase I
MVENKRCHWCGNDALYTKYHDEEWGKETHNEQVLFEFLTLEAAQAGLSWITILRKRENYHRLFANFDAKKVSEFTNEDVEQILLDPGVIRNRLKVVSAISNAKLFLKIQQEFSSFNQYLYSFMPIGKPIQNQIVDSRKTPATSPVSDAISKDMKKRGFKFFGSTICYAFMQAIGMVNDHALDCTFR